MGGDVVPVKVGRVGVRVVAHLAAVGVPVLDAEAADTDGRGGVRRRVEAEAALVEAGQLGLHLLLELVGHQVGGGAGRAGLGVQAQARTRGHLDRGVHHESGGQGRVAVSLVPVGTGHQILGVVLIFGFKFGQLTLVSGPAVPGLPALAVRALQGQVLRLREVVVD